MQSSGQLPFMLAAIVLLLLAALAVRLCFGLFEARSLIRREFFAYFTSPIAYVVMVVFLGVTGALFAGVLDQLTATGPRGVEWPVRALFSDQRFWVVFAALAPLLTMRLFAEERASGTLEMLMTSPLRDWQLVLAKFAGCLLFYAVLWLPTLLYLPALLGIKATLPETMPGDPAGFGFLAGAGMTLLGFFALLFPLGTVSRLLSLLLLGSGIGLGTWGAMTHFGGQGPHLVEITSIVDPFPALSLYVGMFAAGAMFLAIGILVSSMVRDQLVSAVIALAIGLPFVMAGFVGALPGASAVGPWVQYLSVPVHMDQLFGRGIIDSRPLVLYASVTVFCLFMTVRGVEARRWS
jgi:ABC-type transport system involved in multi-copper enzyme maturation permease subunit